MSSFNPSRAARMRSEVPPSRTRTPAARGLNDTAREALIQTAGFFMLFGVWLGLLGPIAPLLVMASFAGLIALAPARAIQGLIRSWPLILIGCLACLSALWSTAPSISLRYGVQLLITIAAAVTLASTLTPVRIVRLLLLSGVVVLLLCLASGRQGQSPAGPVLIGILGSKNEMGSLCLLVACSGLTAAFTSTERPWLRLFALGAAALGLLVLLGTFATGAVLGVLMFMGLSLGLDLGSRLPAASRFALLVGFLALLLPLWMIRTDLAELWEYFVVDILRKDMGLTGRDYLWAHADRLIAERPVLGYGYRSTWLGDSAETLGLLRWAGLTSGAGFNFHDSYREWAVDFGFVGAAVVALCIFAGLYKVIQRSLDKNVTAPMIFFAAMAITIMIRAKLENVLGPFGSTTILIVVILAVGYAYRSAAKLAPPRLRPKLRPSTRPRSDRAPARLAAGLNSEPETSGPVSA